MYIANSMWLVLENISTEFLIIGNTDLDNNNNSVSNLLQKWMSSSDFFLVMKTGGRQCPRQV